ncbi:MAG: P-II family nitrogen regulator [Ignavibacteriales bacterium]|nr:P-II family nitrogen regulator [Ignavibacteriales bacterium]
MVRSDKLDEFREAFLKSGIQKMTVTEVRDYGDSTAHTEIYRSIAFSIDTKARVKVEITVAQKKVPHAVSILKTKGQTGKGGEDKILISTVNDIS